MARRSFVLLEDPQRGMTVLKGGRADGSTPLPMICERVRHFRLQSGMEQKVLAAALGITANSVSNWEAGRSRPDVNHLPKLCEVLGISLYELYGLPEPLDYSPMEKELLQRYRLLSSTNRRLAERMLGLILSLQEAEAAPVLKKLLYFERPLAAGVGDPTEFEGLSEPLYIYDSEEYRRADYVFRINGDSMDPVYHNGDLVLVERVPSGMTLAEGEIGAFIVGNEMYIKEYRIDGLHSYNPNYHILKFSEDQAVYLIGKVLSVLDPKQIASQSDIELFRLLHE